MSEVEKPLRAQDWPPALTAEVKRLWMDGFTALEISKKVGKSRAAICGKIFRLGLVGDRGEEAKKIIISKSNTIRRQRAIKEKERTRLRREREALSKPPKERKHEMVKPAPIVPSAPAFVPPPVEEIEAGVYVKPLELKGPYKVECSWPMGLKGDTWMYCCAPTGGNKVYCTAHHERAHDRRPANTLRKAKRQPPSFLPEVKINF